LSCRNAIPVRDTLYLGVETVGKRKLINAGLILVMLASFTLFYFFIPGFKAAVDRGLSILAQADIRGMRNYLSEFGIIAPIVSMGLMVLQSLASPLPAFVITFANAWVFGWFWGAVYSWTGAMIGAAICYWIAKTFGRPVVEKLVGKKSLVMTDRFFEAYGPHTVMIARLIPLVPFDIISYAAGLTSISFWLFFAATGIGQLPATIIYSLLGENLSTSTRYIFWTITGFLALLILSLAVKQRIKKRLGSDST